MVYPTTCLSAGAGLARGRRLGGMVPFLPFVRRWFESAFHEPTPPQRDGWRAFLSPPDTTR